MKTTKVDDKTTGVMVALLVYPDWLKENIGTESFCYCPASENTMGGRVAGYSYLTANGGPTSYIYYKVNGDVVTYTVWVPGETVAEGHYETKTIALSRLEKDYYVTQSQKNEVNGYVSKLNDESTYAKKIANN